MGTAWILYVYIVIVWVYGCTSQVCGRVYSKQDQPGPKARIPKRHTVFPDAPDVL